MAGLARRSRFTAASAAAAAALLTFVAAPAHAAGGTATPVTRSNLGAAPFVKIRDRALEPGTRRAKRATRAARSGYGGVFYTSAGEPVHVRTSPAYVPDRSVNQSYADFLGGLVHGRELRLVQVYVAPYAEMQSICSPEADACYSDDGNMLVTTGDTPPDGTAIEDLLAHEYG